MKRRPKKVIKHRICKECNLKCEDADKQCPKCGVGTETYSLNTKFEKRNYPQRFPREVEKNRSLPQKPESVKAPGEYPTPPARILRGGQIESKRRKH
jgi:hypothetical protein